MGMHAMDEDEAGTRPDAPAGTSAALEDELPGAPRATPRDEAGETDQRQRAAVEAYARDHEGLTDENEADALEWLLGGARAILFNVPVTLITDRGPAKLTFVVKQLDGRKIEQINVEKTDENTGRFDVIGADIAVVVKATKFIESASGRQIDPQSREWRVVRALDPRGEVHEIEFASPEEATEKRFGLQLGVLSSVAGEVRRVSGLDREAVGKAQRRLVVASGNS